MSKLGSEVEQASAVQAKTLEQDQTSDSTTDHSQMGHSQMHQASGLPVTSTPREPIPTVTDADRAAAFPPVHAHHMHGTRIHDYTLIDHLEVADAAPGTALAWAAKGWIGGDVQKFWWRTEGHARNGSLERASVEALYGRGISAWWDVVAGVRQEFGDGPQRTWLGVGVHGLAPYKFEVAATAYVGPRGRTELHAEAEYDTLLTNRLILQWRGAATLHGKDDPALGIGSGLSTLGAGARLRYEFNRKFAPYIGVQHERAFGRTAELHRASGHGVRETKLVAGVRLWF